MWVFFMVLMELFKLNFLRYVLNIVVNYIVGVKYM